MVEKKKKKKNPIKYSVELTDEQKEVKRLIHTHKVTLLYGEAGTSKTFCSAISALDLIFTKQFKKLYIMRPAVATEAIGYLPGSASEKLSYYTIPLISNLYKAYNKQKIDSMINEGIIETMPLAFIQGITIDSEEILICDESQNITKAQFKAILTRLGKGGKLIFTGDTDQVMLENPSKSGFSQLLTLCGQIPDMACKELKTNYRDEFVQQILNLYH